MKKNKALEMMAEAQKLVLAGNTQDGYLLSCKARPFLRDHIDSQFFHATVAAVLGFYDEALDAGLAALALNSKHAECAALLSKIYRKLLDSVNARKYAEIALNLDPSSVESAMALALDLYNSGDPKGAEDVVLIAYQTEPLNPEVVSFLAILWAYAGRVKEASDLIEGLHPDESFEVYFLDRYIDVLVYCSNFAKAEQFARIRLNKVEKGAYSPVFLAEAWANLGSCLVLQDDAVGAKLCYDKALEIDPTSKVALMNMAAYFRTLEMHKEAIALYQKAAELYPTEAQLYHHLNNLLREIGFLEQARKYGEIALALRPANAAYYANMAATLLASGDLKLGWQHYEARLLEFRAVLDSLKLPTWHGEKADGLGLVLVREQGIGDELLFMTLFAEVMAQFERVSIITHPKLMTLMQRNFPQCKIYSSLDCPLDEIHREHDYMLSIGSLPSLFRNNISDFSRQHFALQVDIQKRDQLSELVRNLPAGTKIGFAWRSILRSLKRDVHYPELENWRSLFAIPGLHWINLQACAEEDELEFVRQQLGERFHQFEQVDHLDDIDSSACLIDCCDLVIAPCVSIAVLAGVLNKPTLFLYYGTNQFALGTDRYPWFASYVPMPRSYDESWGDVFARVESILSGLTISH
jgi:tetratricopeptide (TPR) repeat protein